MANFRQGLEQTIKELVANGKLKEAYELAKNSPELKKVLIQACKDNKVQASKIAEIFYKGVDPDLAVNNFDAAVLLKDAVLFKEGNCKEDFDEELIHCMLANSYIDDETPLSQHIDGGENLDFLFQKGLVYDQELARYWYNEQPNHSQLVELEGFFIRWMPEKEGEREYDSQKSSLEEKIVLAIMSGKDLDKGLTDEEFLSLDANVQPLYCLCFDRDGKKINYDKKQAIVNRQLGYMSEGIGKYLSEETAKNLYDYLKGKVNNDVLDSFAWLMNPENENSNSSDDGKQVDALDVENENLTDDVFASTFSKMREDTSQIPSLLVVLVYENNFPTFLEKLKIYKEKCKDQEELKIIADIEEKINHFVARESVGQKNLSAWTEYKTDSSSRTNTNLSTKTEGKEERFLDVLAKAYSEYQQAEPEKKKAINQELCRKFNELKDNPNFDLTDVDIETGNTPLHYAILMGNIELVNQITSYCSDPKKLPEHQSFWNIKNKNEETPYQLALTMFKDKKTAESKNIFLKIYQFYDETLGISNGIFDIGTATQQMNAFKDGTLDIDDFKEAVQSDDFYFSKKDDDGNTFLHHLAKRPGLTESDLEAVSILFDTIDLTARNKDGKTALDIAIENASMAMVNRLHLTHLDDFYFSKKDDDGNTFLHHLAKREGLTESDLDAVSILFDTIDLTARNKDGKTAWDIALENNSTAMVNRLHPIHLIVKKGKVSDALEMLKNSNNGYAIGDLPYVYKDRHGNKKEIKLPEFIRIALDKDPNDVNILMMDAYLKHHAKLIKIYQRNGEPLKNAGKRFLMARGLCEEGFVLLLDAIENEIDQDKMKPKSDKVNVLKRQMYDDTLQRAIKKKQIPTIAAWISARMLKDGKTWTHLEKHNILPKGEMIFDLSEKNPNTGKSLIEEAVATKNCVIQEIFLVELWRRNDYENFVDMLQKIYETEGLKDKIKDLNVSAYFISLPKEVVSKSKNIVQLAILAGCSENVIKNLIKKGAIVTQEMVDTCKDEEIKKMLKEALKKQTPETSTSMTTTLRNAEAKDEGRGKQASAPQKKRTFNIKSKTN